MNRLPDRVTQDDVGRAVRDLANSWHLPESARDGSPWRDRIRRESSRSWSWPGWGRRLAAAAALALTVTAVAAIVAVWLALPPHGPAASGIGGATPTPRPTPNPALLYSAPPTATTLPTLPAYVLFGAQMPLGRVLVSAGSGPALLDLSSGHMTTIDPAAAGGSSTAFRLPGGGFLCACVTVVEQGSAGTSTTTATVTLRWVGPDGTAERSVVLPYYVGQADSHVTGEPSHAAIRASLNPDGSALYLGWAVERPPVWRSGIDVVDLATGRIVQTQGLPDVADAVSGQSQGVDGATVTIAPGGATAMVGRLLWYPAGGALVSWHALAPVGSGRLGSLTPLQDDPQGLDGGACPGNGGSEAFVTTTSYYEVCDLDTGAIVRRIDSTGRPLGDTVLAGGGGFGLGEGTVVDHARHLLYAWDPFSGRLVRVDLITGRITGSEALPSPTAAIDPVAAVARALAGWLAPVAEAKMYLSPSLAISADGSRLYALGTTVTDPTSPEGGSGGVWVFDTSSLAIVGHWAPLADYISVTLADGGLVLAAGMPGVDTSGVQNDQQDASVVAYDAATGSVRIIAGQVQGSSAGWVLFPSQGP